MKKILLGLVGLSAVLASCGGDVTTSSGDASIYSSSLNLSSGYTMNGHPVICDNLNTPMQFTFDYSGNLNAVNLSLKGDLSDAITRLPNPDPSNTTLNGGHGVVTFYASPTAVPLSIQAKPQSIVINPREVPNAHVIGATRVMLQGVDSYGTATPYVLSNALPVIDNCY